MLKSCKTCKNGLVLPMINIISVYHKGASLYIHNVPFTVCTHCNTHEFVDHLSEIKQVAKNLNDEHGTRTFKYEIVEIKEPGTSHPPLPPYFYWGHWLENRVHYGMQQEIIPVNVFSGYSH